MSRLGLALVLVLFCAPLFVGLRNLDLETDEAIYSFAVDGILADGQWMQPKSSPSNTVVFLEKPPLKFWIVAGPIRLGLLPHDEFGLRFWDAVFGSACFVYVFLIGSLMAGPVCGFVAVLGLFVHTPLIFEHGFRTNNMEAALTLAYCGGIFHALRWFDHRVTRPGAHAVTAGVYFALGFLTKFVAVVFLPAVLVFAVLLNGEARRRLLADWRGWIRPALVAAALILPWFVYAQWQFGSLVWETMLAEHVYARFTTSLNPMHVQPWNFYIRSAWQQFTDARIEWLIALGLVTLTVQAFRRRSLLLTTVAVWAVLPMLAISLGSSKLYHYVYPFLPPLTLAMGYLVALVVMLAPVQVRKLLEWCEDTLARRLPTLQRMLTTPAATRALVALIWIGIALSIATVFTGTVRLGLNGHAIFKSSGLIRPLAAVALFAVLARRSATVALPIVAIVVASLAPMSLYAENIHQLHVARHPMRDAAECVDRVQSASPSLPRGLYVDGDEGIWHPINYYFRRIQPWIHQETPSAVSLERTLRDPASLRPGLVDDVRYRDYRSGPDAARFNTPTSPPMIGMQGYALLLPGPYGVCSPEAALTGAR